MQCKAFSLSPPARYAKCLPIEQLCSSFYLRLSVIDKPGVLAQVATVLASLGVGISSVIQPEGHEGATVPLLLMIHDSPFGKVHEAVERVRNLDCVKAAPVLLWVLS
jgi:homoserine dehydrogenase